MKYTFVPLVILKNSPCPWTRQTKIITDVFFCGAVTYAYFVYMECIYTVFRKYRVSFRLDKCVFLKQRVEYADDGNCPAFSKSSMVND